MNAKTESGITWNGMCYIDDITAKKFGLKSGEITMVRLPISDRSVTSVLFDQRSDLACNTVPKRYRPIVSRRNA